MKAHKLIALLMAIIMLLNVAIPSVVSIADNAEGSATLISYNEYKLIRVIFPTQEYADKSIDYIVDPQRLIPEAKSYYSGAVSMAADSVNGGTGVYFLVSGHAGTTAAATNGNVYSNTSKKLVVTNKSSCDIDIIANAKTSVGDGDTMIGLATDAQSVSEDSPLYLGFYVKSGSNGQNAALTSGSTGIFVYQTLNGAYSNFEAQDLGDGSFSFGYKNSPQTPWDSTNIYLDGAVATVRELSGELPTINVTWSYNDPSGITFLGDAGVSSYDLRGIDYRTTDLDSGNLYTLYTPRLSSIAYGRMSGTNFVTSGSAISSNGSVGGGLTFSSAEHILTIDTDSLRTNPAYAQLGTTDGCYFVLQINGDWDGEIEPPYIENLITMYDEDYHYTGVYTKGSASVYTVSGLTAAKVSSTIKGTYSEHAKITVSNEELQIAQNMWAGVSAGEYRYIKLFINGRKFIARMEIANPTIENLTSVTGESYQYTGTYTKGTTATYSASGLTAATISNTVDGTYASNGFVTVSDETVTLARGLWSGKAEGDNRYLKLTINGVDFIVQLTLANPTVDDLTIDGLTAVSDQEYQYTGTFTKGTSSAYTVSGLTAATISSDIKGMYSTNDNVTVADETVTLSESLWSGASAGDERYLKLTIDDTDYVVRLTIENPSIDSMVIDGLTRVTGEDYQFTGTYTKGILSTYSVSGLTAATVSNTIDGTYSSHDKVVVSDGIVSIGPKIWTGASAGTYRYLKLKAYGVKIIVRLTIENPTIENLTSVADQSYQYSGTFIKGAVNTFSASGLTAATISSTVDGTYTTHTNVTVSNETVTLAKELWSSASVGANKYLKLTINGIDYIAQLTLASPDTEDLTIAGLAAVQNQDYQFTGTYTKGDSPSYSTTGLTSATISNTVNGTYSSDTKVTVSNGTVTIAQGLWSDVSVGEYRYLKLTINGTDYIVRLTVENPDITSMSIDGLTNVADQAYQFTGTLTKGIGATYSIPGLTAATICNTVDGTYSSHAKVTVSNDTVTLASNLWSGASVGDTRYLKLAVGGVEIIAQLTLANPEIDNLTSITGKSFHYQGTFTKGTALTINVPGVTAATVSSTVDGTYASNSKVSVSNGTVTIAGSIWGGVSSGTARFVKLTIGGIDFIVKLIVNNASVDSISIDGLTKVTGQDYQFTGEFTKGTPSTYNIPGLTAATACGTVNGTYSTNSNITVSSETVKVGKTMWSGASDGAYKYLKFTIYGADVIVRMTIKNPTIAGCTPVAGQQYQYTATFTKGTTSTFSASRLTAATTCGTVDGTYASNSKITVSNETVTLASTLWNGATVGSYRYLKLTIGGVDFIVRITIS